MAVDTSTMNGFWSDQPNLLCTTARVIGGSALLCVNERSPPALAFAKVRLFETRPSRLWEGKSFVIQQFLWLIVHGWSTENLSFWPHLDEQSKKLQNVYSNLYSQAVTHPSTNRSQPCLTSVIRRELVYSRWYGRRQCWSVWKSGHFNPLKSDSCCDHHSKLAYTTELTQDRSTSRCI